MVEQFATMNRRQFSFRFRPCEAVRMKRRPLTGLTGDFVRFAPYQICVTTIAGIILPATSLEMRTL